MAINPFWEQLPNHYRLQVALTPRLSFSNSTSALPRCPCTPLGKHTRSRPPPTPHPFSATQPPHNPHYRAGTRDMCPQPVPSAQCGCRCRAEQENGPEAMACVDHTTVLGYLKGTGMGSWYPWGAALIGQICQKSLLLQRLGRGEDCPSPFPAPADRMATNV